MTFVRVAGAATALVLITLCFQCAGMAMLIRWGKDHLAKCLRRPGATTFRGATGAIHESDYLHAHVGDSVVGVVLSPRLSSIMGNVFLFLDNELLQRRLWRRCAPGNVACFGPDRKCHGCADVRPVRQLAICYRYPTRWCPGTALIRTPRKGELTTRDRNGMHRCACWCQ